MIINDFFVIDIINIIFLIRIKFMINYLHNNKC